MAQLRFNRNFLMAAAVVTAVIIYGSLYPFAFRQRFDGLGPAVRALFESWAERPSLSDFIGNVLLYTPFGFFASLSMDRGIGTAKRLALATLAGALLSICMEITQYYDEGRVTSATDLYANAFGTVLGAIGGSLTGANFRWPLLREIAANPIPMLLLSGWVGYRLFPYVPTLDLHKYWHALKPLILHPSLTGYDLLRYTAIWLTIGGLIEAIGGSKRFLPLFALFLGSVLVAKVLVIDATITLAEIAGAAVALCVWSILAVDTRVRVPLIALLFCGYVVAERLEPFQFSVTAAPFSWIPFLGFMSGALPLDILSFFQKFFLYGSSIWLLSRAGLRLLTSTLVIAVILLATSQAERFLPNRSAEITDTVMALTIGGIFALIETETRRNRMAIAGRGLHVAVSRRGQTNQASAQTRTIAPTSFEGRGLAPPPTRGEEPTLLEYKRIRPVARLARLVVAAACLLLAAAIAANYPLKPGLLGITLTIYAAALWRWPSLWLAVVPALLPALDLTPWTGWIYVGEPDLFVLVTIGVLALRAPPQQVDFGWRGLPAVALGLTALSYMVSVALGLSLSGPAGGSDNPYLRPDNALRLAKGFLIALALLPFLRERMRAHGNVLAWLGAGMSAGLALVAVATLAERALFTGLFDFTSKYRVVATFSSMHIGGGHIGAYIAMALPFLLVFLLRPHALTLLALLGIAVCGGYALVVSYARAAYAAALVSVVTACGGWISAGIRRDRVRPSSLLLPIILLLPVAGLVIAALDAGFMSERLKRVAPDLARREENWKQGLALRDQSLIGALVGTGLGTYPRIVFADKSDGRYPTNYVVEHDGAYPFLSVKAGLPIYFGQKVLITPDQKYRVFVSLRSPDGGGALTILLCEKLLLYADNCRRVTFRPRGVGNWEDFGAAISSTGLNENVILGWLRRPIELALLDPDAGTTIDVGHIRMFDSQGHEILANGGFTRGTERWYFTDDQHVIWRIHDQYLMSFFEGGALGLTAFLLLAGTALLGAVRALGRGDRMAAAVAGSLAAFLFSGAFDNLLEAPRLSALFYIVAFAGLALAEKRTVH
jgi:hypothetical protein